MTGRRLSAIGPLTVLVLVWANAIGAAEPSARPTPTTCEAARFTVAIDTGHTPERPGATSATGQPEFQFNAVLAGEALAALRRAGFGSAFAISDPNGLTLTRRTEIANDAGADLLLSIHHDSVQPRYLSTWLVEGREQRYSDHFQGFSLFYSEKNPQAARSRYFAELLGTALRRRGLAPTLHHAEPIEGENRPLIDRERGLYRFDDLVVLKTARMPAVLFEAGLIVNRVEERLLRTPAHRAKLTGAMVEAIRQFCAQARP